MPTALQKPKLPAASGYVALVKKITSEISSLELFIKRRSVQAYWQIGKFIHEHLLSHKERARYGATLLERLSKDVDRDRSTLQRALEFYRLYPIRAASHKLTWEHYRNLITIKDPRERKKLEEKIIRQDWDTRKLRAYLNARREGKSTSSGKQG